MDWEPGDGTEESRNTDMRRSEAEKKTAGEKTGMEEQEDADV